MQSARFGLRQPFKVVTRKFSKEGYKIGEGFTVSAANIPKQLYEKVWQKSNIAYITYIVVGCIVLEFVYGSATGFIWDTYNQGVRIIKIK